MTAPGEFVLYSYAATALPAGSYQMQVTQTVTDKGGAPIPGAAIEPRTTRFDVTAPRFTLPPDQVLSTFPPNRAAGAFSTRLPQIVLRRRTLPWERRPASGQAVDVPWLALVVLAEGEGEFRTDVRVDDVFTKPLGLQGPSDSTVADSLTVSNRVRHGVFPHKDEVELLAHVRRVDLTDTEMALGDDDGDLAVVVANRLPLGGQSYTAYLISLEGQFDRLGLSTEHESQDTAQHDAPIVSEVPSTTWPVLAHWSFTSVGQGDFQSLMQGLDVGMLGEIHAPAATSSGKPPPPPRPNPPEVDDAGHVLVDHVSRDGEPDRVLYRGPLLNHPGVRDAPDAAGRLPLWHTSDEARAVRAGGDGDPPVQDLSLATAFEIGRLLALAEPSVVAALLLWRTQVLAGNRAAALLALHPALAALGTHDAGSGFAARTGLALLTALGADDARRLHRRAGPVRPGGPPLDLHGRRLADTGGPTRQEARS